jgi:hypothetical protein
LDNAVLTKLHAAVRRVVLDCHGGLVVAHIGAERADGSTLPDMAA